MPSHDRQGRSKGTERHTRLSYVMTGSPAWRDLSGSAIKVLIALQRLDRGQDNGNLYLSVRKAADEAGCSPNTAGKALRELESHGFIAPIERGYFSIKGGPASQWRLTFVAAPALKMMPTHEWQRWRPDGNKSQSQKLMETVAVSDTPGGNRKRTDAKIATTPTETSDLSVSTLVPTSATQIHCHRQGAQKGVSPKEKQPNSAGGVSDELLIKLRDQVRTYLSETSVGEQTRIALATGMPGGTLSKFLSGRRLPLKHYVALEMHMADRQRRRAA